MGKGALLIAQQLFRARNQQPDARLYLELLHQRFPDLLGMDQPATSGAQPRSRSLPRYRQRCPDHQLPLITLYSCVHITLTQVLNAAGIAPGIIAITSDDQRNQRNAPTRPHHPACSAPHAPSSAHATFIQQHHAKSNAAAGSILEVESIIGGLHHLRYHLHAARPQRTPGSFRRSTVRQVSSHYTLYGPRRRTSRVRPMTTTRTGCNPPC